MRQYMKMSVDVHTAFTLYNVFFFIVVILSAESPNLIQITLSLYLHCSSFDLFFVEKTYTNPTQYVFFKKNPEFWAH